MSVPATAAVVGVGSSPYHRRGGSYPRTTTQLACTAVLAAVEDAGLGIEDVDGFAYYNGGLDTGLLAQILGVPEVRFSASVTGGGGGSAGCVGLAAAAATSGQAEVVVSVMALQQHGRRFGAAFAASQHEGDSPADAYAPPSTPEFDFLSTAGLVGPAQLFSLLVRRHMHLYGTTREHFAEVAVSTRANAISRPSALMRTPLSFEEYFAARMITDCLGLYDCCLETDGAVAVITTTAARARDLRHRPVHVLAAAQGGAGRWGQGIGWLGMPEEYFASGGQRPLATRLYGTAGIAPDDVDVALLYDHFAPMVLLQLEDYGFCPVGGAGDFVAAGNIRFGTGSLPVNTHGGHLSEAYVIGMTHVREGVEQLRGSAVNQVQDAEIALVTGGPAAVPMSSLLLGR